MVNFQHVITGPEMRGPNSENFVERSAHRLAISRKRRARLASY